MPWWGWIVIGLFLLGSELLGVDAAFYLIFIGFAAILTGVMGLIGITLPEWAQWLTFAALALGSMVLFRAKLYQRFRGVSTEFRSTLIGEVVDVKEDIPVNKRARINLRGSTWTAINVGQATIEAGKQATVVDAEGALLSIERVIDSNSQGDS